jgi:UDP-N-acetylglucosamine 2-epimerase (non-hydrolysing)
VRANTERPITLRLGSNVLAGTDPEGVLKACLQQLEMPKRSQSIPLWDGRSANRIVETLARATLGRELEVGHG